MSLASVWSRGHKFRRHKWTGSSENCFCVPSAPALFAQMHQLQVSTRYHLHPSSIAPLEVAVSRAGSTRVRIPSFNVCVCECVPLSNIIQQVRERNKNIHSVIGAGKRERSELIKVLLCPLHPLLEFVFGTWLVTQSVPFAKCLLLSNCCFS